LLWRYSSNFSEFGLNAFTETLGIIVTVLIVDQLIKNQEFRKSLPLRYAAYDDVRLLIARMVSFWDEAFKQSVPLTTPRTVEELFSETTFQEIARYLDLDSEPKVIPTRTWWQYLYEQQEDFILRGEKILERHTGNLDPDAYALVHSLATKMTDPKMLNGLRAARKQMGFPNPHNLGNNFWIGDQVLITILQLYSWCKKEKMLLESYGLSVRFSPPDKLSFRDAIASPPCMMSSEKFQQQLSVGEEFRKQAEIERNDKKTKQNSTEATSA